MLPPDVPPLPEFAADHALSARVLAAVVSTQSAMLAVKERPSGRYCMADAAFAGWLDRRPADVLGMTDADLFDGAVALVLRTADQTAMAQAAPMLSEHRIERPGDVREFRVLRVADERHVATVWFDQAPLRQRDRQLRSALDQVEQLQQANADLRRDLAEQTLRDPASGLNTRTHFQDQLRREVDLSLREHREFAMVLVELDPPTDAVRDRGEPAHAQLLEAIGRLLRSGTRAMDTSCRWDDSRFAVLLSGVGLATAHSRMEGLRRRCATQIVLHDGVELGFTVAMGVASFPHTAQSLEGLVASCEGALAEARRRGGNHVTLASIALGG